MTDRILHVGVLMGGESAEREISLLTGAQIVAALDASKYQVTPIHDAREIVGLPEALDVVMIALHGPGGEDGTVQGFLEVLKIPYTGSGVLASAVAMNKSLCKRLLESAGIRTPRGAMIKKGEAVPTEQIGQGPWIVKPNEQGSTIGITIVGDIADLPQAVDTALHHGPDVLIEEFIEGTEITVPVIGNQNAMALPIVEIVPSSGFYDYEAKYTPGATEEIVPARISDAAAQTARQAALAAHVLLGCRGVSRTDMIVKADDEVVVLEVNTIPGMTKTSLLPLSADAAGIPFPRLLDRLIELALDKEGTGR